MRTQTKTCTKCLKAKPLSEFHKDASKRDGLYSSCKHCVSVYHRKHHAGHPEWIHTRLWRTYGITLTDYDEMLESQGGGCAICGKTAEENDRRLCVDHDHETGEIRGLLCTQCNHALGLLQDSPEICKQAMLYLQPQEQTGQ